LKTEYRETIKQEKRVRFVVLFTLLIVAIEAVVGITSHSMALLADAIHLISHELIFGLNWAAYLLVRRLQNKHSESYDTQKILSLSAFTSGIFLLATAIFIVIEAVERLNGHDEHITNHNVAIITAIIGLVANIICVYVMYDKKGDSDYNSRAVYLHLLSDILAKVGIVVGIVCAMLWNILWIDAAIAIVSALIAAHWARNLLWDTGRKLTKTQD
jgi:cation diffusion facilitator family transporter